MTFCEAKPRSVAWCSRLFPGAGLLAPTGQPAPAQAIGLGNGATRIDPKPQRGATNGPRDASYRPFRASANMREHFPRALPWAGAGRPFRPQRRVAAAVNPGRPGRLSGRFTWQRVAGVEPRPAPRNNPGPAPRCRRAGGPAVSSPGREPWVGEYTNLSKPRRGGTQCGERPHRRTFSCRPFGAARII